MNGASVIVPVTFNGALRANLALDTGATITVVSRRIATNLALNTLGVSKVGTVAGVIADEGESDEDEGEDQPGVVRADQAAGGERRPRRRGRRGGRRRRGGPEDGLAGSIADELGPSSAPEATSSVADFDGYSSEPASLPEVQPESIAPPPEQAPPEPAPAEHAWPEPMRAPTEAGTARDTGTARETETAQEAERAARRRSTVREKVSFLVNAQPEAAPPVNHSPPEPSAAAEAEPATGTTTEDPQPRKAGWWSRRFGSGE